MEGSLGRIRPRVHDGQEATVLHFFFLFLFPLGSTRRFARRTRASCVHVLTFPVPSRCPHLPWWSHQLRRTELRRGIPSSGSKAHPHARQHVERTSSSLRTRPRSRAVVSSSLFARASFACTALVVTVASALVGRLVGWWFLLLLLLFFFDVALHVRRVVVCPRLSILLSFLFLARSTCFVGTASSTSCSSVLGQWVLYLRPSQCHAWLVRVPFPSPSTPFLTCASGIAPAAIGSSFHPRRPILPATRVNLVHAATNAIVDTGLHTAVPTHAPVRNQLHPLPPKLHPSNSPVAPCFHPSCTLYLPSCTLFRHQLHPPWDTSCTLYLPSCTTPSASVAPLPRHQLHPSISPVAPCFHPSCTPPSNSPAAPLHGTPAAPLLSLRPLSGCGRCVCVWGVEVGEARETRRIGVAAGGEGDKGASTCRRGTTRPQGTRLRPRAGAVRFGTAWTIAGVSHVDGSRSPHCGAWVRPPPRQAPTHLLRPQVRKTAHVHAPRLLRRTCVARSHVRANPPTRVAPRRPVARQRLRG